MTPMTCLPTSLLVLLTALPAQEIDRKAAKELEEVIEQYILLDGKTAEGHAGRAPLLARVEELAPGTLSGRDVEKWSETILEIWEDGPELEDGGREYFWEEEKKGLYITGGTTRRPKGLLIGMHGGGAGSGDAGSSASYLSSGAKNLKWVGIFPEVLEKTEHGWTDSGTEEWVLELVDRARRTYGIDPNKVYFAGHSMGGYGSWTLGAHHADRVAALGPTAGAPTPYLDAGGNTVDIVEGVVPNLRNVAVRVFQSADDPRVPPDVNRVAARKVAEAKEKWGGYENFEYIEVDGLGHGLPPGGGKAWLEGLSEFERDPRPRKVVWQPWLDWKRQFYWLEWESPVRGRIIVAEVGEDSVVRIRQQRRQGVAFLAEIVSLFHRRLFLPRRKFQG